jgi:hypothetical protein
MTFADWFTLPTKEWAGSLVGLSLAVVSAAAAVFSSAHLGWIAELESATDACLDERNKVRLRTTSEGARAYSHLKQHRSSDPKHNVGWVVLFVAAFMTGLGVIAGLQIADVGWLFTIVPIVIAALVSVLAVFAPGRKARTAADARLAEMEKPKMAVQVAPATTPPAPTG